MLDNAGGDDAGNPLRPRLLRPAVIHPHRCGELVPVTIALVIMMGDTEQSVISLSRHTATFDSHFLAWFEPDIAAEAASEDFRAERPLALFLEQTLISIELRRAPVENQAVCR